MLRRPSGFTPFEYSLLFPITLCFVLLSVLTFHANPYFDDFCRAAWGNQVSLWENISREYRHWCGRWAGVGIGYFLGGLGNLFELYSLWLTLISLSVLSGFFLLTTLLLPKFSFFQRFGFSVLSFAFYWSRCPDPRETFFWMTGAIENHLGFACSLLVVSALIRRKGSRFFLAAMILFVCALHEIWAAYLLGVLTLLALHRKEKLPWLIATMVAAAIVVLAPGNFERQLSLPVRGDFSFRLALGLDQITTLFGKWVLDPGLWVLSFLILANSHAIKFASKFRFRLSLLSPLVFLFIAFLVLSITNATGRVLPGRTLSALYLIFFSAWLTGLGLIGNSLRKQIQPFHSVLCLALLVCLVSNRNTIEAVKDITLKVAHYESLSLQRQRQVQAQISEGKGKVIVPRLTFIPFHYQKDLTAEPKQWINRCMANYYGLESIQVP